MDKKTTNTHPCHHKEIAKINRVLGQVEGIKKMIEDKRYCPDILTQLRATRAALKTIEASILQTHLGHCVDNALTSGDKNKINEIMEEVKTLFKRYEE